MKYWEIIADNLGKADWSWGCVSALDSHGRTIWIVDAHRSAGKRFIVWADEKLVGLWNLGQRSTQVQGDLLFIDIRSNPTHHSGVG